MGLHGRTALIALGAGINLSTYGIGVWSENVLMTNGAFVGSGAAALSDTYLLFATLGLFIALLVRVGVAARTGASNRHYLAWGLGPMLCAALLFLSGLWNSTGPLVALAAFCTGWSFSCQTLFWMISLSFEPAQMNRAFPLELAFAAAINALFVAGFTDHQDLFLGCGLLLSTGVSVILTRMDAALDRPAVVAPALSLERSYLPAFRAFAEVLFCVVALQTIAPTLNYMGLLGALSADQQQIAVTAAKVAAAGILAVVLRFSRAPLYSIQVFKVVTPICSSYPSRRAPTCSSSSSPGRACTSSSPTRCSASTPLPSHGASVSCSSSSTASALPLSWHAAPCSSTSCRSFWPSPPQRS